MAGDAVLTLASALAALILVTRAPRGSGGRPLAVALGVWSYLLAYSGVVALLRPADPTSWQRTLFEVHFLLVELLGLAALIRFTAIFPRPLGAEDLEPSEDLPRFMGPLQRLRTVLLGARAPWVAAVVMLAVAVAVNAAVGRPTQDVGLLVVVDLVRLAALSVVVANLRASYLAATGVQRARLHWLAWGFALLLGTIGLLIGLNVLLTVTGWRIPGFNWRPVLLDLGILSLVMGSVLGVLRPHATDPGPRVRSAVLMSGIVLMTLLLASGIEALFSGALVAGLRLPAGVGTVMAVGIMQVVFTRVRSVMDLFLSQAWGGEAADARQSVVPG